MLSSFDVFLQQVMRFNDAAIFILIAFNALSLVFLFVSVLEIIRFRRTRTLVGESHLLQSEEAPSVSIVCPVQNEELTIVEKTLSLTQLHYPKLEVIIVCDGSTDKTLKRLIDEFKLIRLDFLYAPAIQTKTVRDIYRAPAHPRLLVVDKAAGGRADALNAGINISRNELVCVVSPDTLLKEDALLLNVYPFVRWKNKVAAVSSIIRMINGCTVESGRVVNAALPKSLLLLFQLVESARSFLTGRFAWNTLKATLTLPEAFGIYRKDLMVDAGGYAANADGEDLDLMIRLQRLMRLKNDVKSVFFLPQAVCWAERPATRKALALDRWKAQRGLLRTLWAHKSMLLNPRFGALGLLSLPILLFAEVFVPLLELLAYFSLLLCFSFGMLQAGTLLLFLIVTVLFGFLASVCGILIEETLFHRYGRLGDILKLTLVAFLENFGYRQMLLFVRARAFLSLFSRRKAHEQS